MIYNPTKCLGTLALLLALTVVLAMRPVEAEAGPFENVPIKLLIGGMNPNEAMADENALIAMLNQYGVPRPTGASLRQWIRDIEGARNGHGAPVLGSLGGIQARALLWVAGRSLNPGTGNYVAPPGAETFGQIEQQCDGQPGYSYDSATGEGRLCVTMFTTTTQGSSNQTVTRAERILVVVEAGGFDVEPKNASDPNNVFPVFSNATGLVINQATASGFNNKLWASGTLISIRKVWRDMNYNPNAPNFHPVNLNAVPNRSLQIPDPEGCIDMMFMGNPPATLPATMAPPQYCLGRCRNPPIINTR